MYYIMRVSLLEDHGVRREPGRPLSTEFQKGQYIHDEVTEPLSFEVSHRAAYPPPDFLGLIVPIMSRRMLECLRQAGVDNLQSFACRLLNPQSGDVWTDYQAVNIIGSVKCADLEKSLYSDPTGSGEIAVMFDRLVIREQDCRGQLVFRLYESLKTILLHESIAGALTETQPKLTGFDLIEVDGV